MYDKLTGINKKNIEISVNKPHIKPTKPNSLNKGLDVHQGRKKTMSHHTGANVYGLVSDKMDYNNDRLVAVESTNNGTHKKHRQPKQRVGVSSKVSSSEKDSNKKAIKGTLFHIFRNHTNLVI